jgi:predicted outer membrane repeat protein
MRKMRFSSKGVSPMSHRFQMNWKRTALIALVIGLALIGHAARSTQAAPATPDFDLPLPNIIVNTTAIADDPNDGKCDLWEALQAVFQANYGLSPAYHECTAKVNAMNIIGFSVIGGSITIPTAPGSRTDLPFVHGNTVIVGPIAIVGGGSAADTHLLRTAPNATLTVIGVSLKDGHTSGAGAAIYSDNYATVNVIGSFLIDNVADNDGGAIYANGDLNLIGTSFITNRANGSPGRGGAVYMTGSGSFKSEASTFTGNKANAGGAVYIEKAGGAAAINDSIFTANIVTGDANHFGGGAVYNSGGTLEVQRTAFNANLGVQGQGGALVNNVNATALITNTLFDGNIAGDTGSAMDGGAIKNLGTLAVGRSTFVANWAQGGSGGAIATAANNLSIANSTFSANVAAVQGGALLISGTAQTTIRNSTLANNTASTGASALYNYGAAQTQIGNTILDRGAASQSNCASTNGITSLGHNIDSDGSCGLAASGDVAVPPLLNGLNFNGGALPVLTTHKTSYNSPAIDNGDSSICADQAVGNEDEIGTKRPKDANNTGTQLCDIGAVELEARTPAFNAMPLPPGPLNFGDVVVNTTLTTTLVISNSGDYVLTVSNPGIDDAAHFSVSNFPASLDTKAQATLVLGCTPTTTGPLQGTFSFNTTDPNKPTVAYTLLCVGALAAQPVFASQPAAVVPIEFGEVAVGETMTRSITVQNIGKAPLSITAATLTGSNGFARTIALPFNVAVGASQAFAVRCQPTDVGLLAGYLHLTTNDPAQPTIDYQLNCAGTAPASADLVNISNFKAGLFLPADLINPVEIAVSPDNLNAYLVANRTPNGGQIVTLKKTSSGTYLPMTVVTDSLLALTYGIATSPNGKYVLATGAQNNALMSYRRDSGSGALTYLGVERNGMGGVTSMNYPVRVTYSPDSQFVYVAGYNDDAIAIFKQVTTTASNLSFVGSIAATTMTTHTLGRPRAFVVSPDGKNLYVLAETTDVLAVYQRDVKTGLLTPIQTRYQGDCQDTPSLCLFPLDGLNLPHDIAISPDGHNVYVTGYSSNALVTFNRDPVTGLLKGHRTLVDSTGAIGLRGATDVTVSPNGKYVYTASSLDNILTVFDRDNTNGAVAFRQLYQRDVGSGTPALGGATFIAVTNDGQYVFVSAYNDIAVVVFQAANPVPTLTSLQPASVVAGSSDFTLVIKGSGFVKGLYAEWNTYHPTTTFVNSSEVHATIPAAWITAAGTYTIGVHNLTPGGGDSFNTLTFQVTSAALQAQADQIDPLNATAAGVPVPSIDHLNPAGVTAGTGGIQVDVYGSNFSASGLTVTANGSGAIHSFIDSTHVRIVGFNVNTFAQPGTVNIQVNNNGVQSNIVGLNVAAPGQNAVPSITSLSTDWAWSHGAGSKDFTFSVTGKNFVDGATVQWNGENRPAQFVDSSHLRVTIFGLDQLTPGSNGLTITNPPPGGGTSETVPFIVRAWYPIYLPLMMR